MAINQRTVSDAADYIMEEISPAYKVDKLISLHCPESVELFVTIADAYREEITDMIDMDSYESAREVIEQLLGEMFESVGRKWYSEEADVLWEEYIVPVFEQLKS